MILKKFQKLFKIINIKIGNETIKKLKKRNIWD